jgi:2-polyprenyl-6-hydroxyphenyl methylase/3-demethylubiquinone-9 3-methyltransferase
MALAEPGTPTPASTVDAAEIARFAALAEDWWRPGGSMRALHRINPVRLAFIKEEVCRHFGRDVAALDAFSGLRMLDIGCGGGILSEPLARLGAEVVGADAAAETIAAARLHAGQSGLGIDYRATTAEALAAAGERFDVVLALEIIEHVPDAAHFVRLCAGMVKERGLMICSTLNRTMRAFALAIVGAEYVLGWLPRGTHQWSKFVTPAELEAAFRAAALKPGEARGMVYDPLGDRWRLAADTAVNYLMVARA